MHEIWEVPMSIDEAEARLTSGLNAARISVGKGSPYDSDVHTLDCHYQLPRGPHFAVGIERFTDQRCSVQIRRAGIARRLTPKGLYAKVVEAVESLGGRRME